jgi:CelD/BcsL family acetyltransferase involved in cellulose biosynthesis
MRAHVRQGSAPEAEVVPRVERVERLERLREEWNGLARAGGGIFATWEWADAWWRHYGRGRELLVSACRAEDASLVAVLPLYAWRSRWPRVLRFIGHGPGDELGPVHRPGEHVRGAQALRAALRELDWDVFLGEQLPGDEGWDELLEARRWRREASPVLRVPEGRWEAFLAGRSANFRQQLTRRLRRLEDVGARFRLAEAASLDRDLDALFALHRARWGGRPTDFADTPFHREVARRALAQGWLRLWLLELDGRPVAAWHGFHVGTVTSYYQAGRDPAYERLSLGFVLLAHSLRAAIDEGATEYRFGRGAEEFKYRFTPHDPGLDTVLLARGASGRGAVAAARAAASIGVRGAARRTIDAIPRTLRRRR